MKKLIIFFIVLLAAIWLGIIMHRYPGFVLIHVGHTRVETTLWIAILSLIVLFIVLHMLIALFRGVYNIPTRYAHWSERRSESSSHQKMEQAVFSLLEDDYESAEKNFLKSAKLNRAKLLSYLGAAKSAQAQQQLEERDKYLAKARKIAEGEQVKTVDMIKVRWQVESEQWILALVTLEALPTDHPFTLKMRKRIYIAQKNWKALEKLLPEIKQKGVLKGAEFNKLKQAVLLALMKEALVVRNHMEAEKIWKGLPKSFKSDPELLSVYSEHLITEGKHDEAEDLLKNAIKYDLHPALLTEYARIKSSKPAKQLSRAEAWLKSHPENPDLLYCLGKLCQQHRLWGKAKKYFESSIKIYPTKQVYQALGSVLERLNETPKALVCYKQGIEKT